MDNDGIPKISVPCTDGLKLNLNNEKLIDLYEYSNGEIICSMEYFKQGINGAVNHAYVRESVAQRLMQARMLLPDGYTFKIFDAWRPYEVQYKLYYDYFNKLANQENNSGLSDEQLRKKAADFVSYPDKSKKISYVHSTGGAVDLTVADKNGKELDMGTGFDSFYENSHTAFYEVHADMNETAKENRRLLYEVMVSCGFTNLPTEWWHYDFGDSFWSALTGNDVLYESIYNLEF